MGRDLYELPPPRQPRAETGMSRRALLRLRLTERARADIDYAGVTDRVRAGWERDGYEPLLRALEPVATELVEAAAVGGGSRVLDAGAGDGNVARAALSRAAVVEACDLSPVMVARGRAACPGAEWAVADVQALPYPDESFDAVLSSFAAVLAPRAMGTARELLRVARPGGAVVLTAWVPRGLPGRFAELAEQQVPLPYGVPSPADWGRQEIVRRRLEPQVEELEIRLRTVRIEFPGAEALFDALARPAGLTDRDRSIVRPEFDRLLASCNADPAAVRLDARYLLITGRRTSAAQS